ncbi:adenylate/guanylate cyclase domain-containing protein [Nocardioides humilatus]|uniref:Adenylate/guanylate cyclase domain-containing protein n=1 Tax=Nocardioides humilatus TaxID=2607660 RepID=A0A5B1L6S1_9ACTN|nr:adenylate/guanylate cyclase domain-containing protein [Nocardioides humilatus]KAA1416401.1 adenylate/guanylate cyclase domain-containing protein [Nocardioides humilatus]
MERRLPRGRVTFAFVDVVESTRTFAEHGDAFVTALAVLQDRVARQTEHHGGTVVKTEGDGAFLAFPDARGAIDALVALQDELAAVSDAGHAGPRLTVRAGVHTGDAVPVADDYVALAVNVAARVTSTVGAGQVVVSAATQAELPEPVGVCVGDYDLKDVADPVELWRVCGDETPLRGSPSRRTNVRIPVTGFVGRTRELADLRREVEEHPLVTVVGPGGLGKTRIVSELLLEIATGLKGGAWLVELASVNSGDQVPAAVAAVLGIGSGEVGALASELRRRDDVLLVLDNCEHVLDAVADLVADLEQACPSLRLLCTSREPLQVPGERVWRLGPFVGHAARIELFTQRAWASGATVSDDSVPLVDRLCDALDGLPLAIELAATHAGSTTLEQLVQIAEHGTDDLARRGGQARQRSLDAVLAWSLDRLPEERRRALLVLSVLPGRFDLPMAAAILGAVEGCEADAVRHLARGSLVDLDGESYRILDTIRHAAQRRRLADPDLAQAARRGLRAWALAVAERDYRVARRWDDVPTGEVQALEAALEQAVDDGVRDIGKLWERVRAIAYERDPGERIVELADRILAGPLPASRDDALCTASALSIRQIVGLPRLDAARIEAICEAADRFGVYFAAANLPTTWCGTTPSQATPTRPRGTLRATCPTR